MYVSSFSLDYINYIIGNVFGVGLNYARRYLYILIYWLRMSLSQKLFDRPV